MALWVTNCRDAQWLARQLRPRKQLPLLRDGAAVEGQERPKCGAAKSGLFDHLVGRGEQRLREGEAKRLCGLEIDVQHHLGGLLDR